MAGGLAGAASYYFYIDIGAGSDVGRGEPENLRAFQVFCICAALVSGIGFWWTGTHLDLKRLDQQQARVEAGGKKGLGEGGEVSEVEHAEYTAQGSMLSQLNLEEDNATSLLLTGPRLSPSTPNSEDG
ncbi:unnamed protein product, partial [Choristocarpus tenellus]